MALKDILVHVDHAEISERQLNAAFTVAEANGAHVIGVHAKAMPFVPDLAAPAVVGEFMEIQEKYASEAAQKAEALFNARASKSSVPSEWRTVSGDPVEQLALHGRYVDLVVVGQQNPDVTDVPVLRDVPDRLILSIGRPVLVVPYTGDFSAIGKNVLVSWDASRLATRAVNDALPLLEGSDQVNVLAINPGKGIGGHGEIPCADICLHLARHGVNAEAHSVSASDVDVGDLILSRAADFGADLIVMGAYGHRRLRELALGGATRHILNHMTVPVFMSH